MTKRKDVMGVEPEIGDNIVFNPPHYKGLLIKECVGFSKSGLPQIEGGDEYVGTLNKDGYATPKTGFVVIKR